MNYSKAFIKAVDIVLDHEGGYNNIPEDKGGATKYGISLRFLKNNQIEIDGHRVIDYRDVQQLDKSRAIEIYYEYFWNPVYEQLPERLAIKIFNISVNAGHNPSHKLLQEALNLHSHISISEDGNIGPITLGAIGRVDITALLPLVCLVQLAFYTDIIMKDASQKIFYRGWKNRAFFIPD